DDDNDFGSDGPVLVPGTNTIIAGGKAGLVTLIDRTNMGHQMQTDDGILQAFLAIPSGVFAIFNTAFWSQPGGGMLYLWAFNDVLRQFQMQNGVFNTTPVATNSTPNSLPFSGMTVSSNGSVPGSGVFWATTISDTHSPAPGALHAF